MRIQTYFIILVSLLVGLGIGIPCLLGDMRVLHLYVLEGGIVLILVYLVFFLWQTGETHEYHWQWHGAVA